MPNKASTEGRMVLMAPELLFFCVSTYNLFGSKISSDMIFKDIELQNRWICFFDFAFGGLSWAKTNWMQHPWGFWPEGPWR